MKIQLVQTTGWYKENGQSSWGLGVNVDHFAEYSYGKHEADDRLTPGGWQVVVQVGTWALFFTSDAGVVSLEGPSHWPKPFFEIARP